MARKLQAKNDIELVNMVMPALEQAVDYVVQKIWNDNRELIRKLVYETYQPSEYQRSGEFKQAWTTVDSKTSGNKTVGRFEYDPDSMSVGHPSTERGTPDYGKHASAVKHASDVGDSDAREYLAEIIYQGLAGPAFGYGPVHDGAWTKKRDVWEALIKKLGTRKFKSYFHEGLRLAGVKFRDTKEKPSIRRFNE